VMNTLRIAICEDDKAAAAALTGAIRDWADAKKVDVDFRCFDNAEAFIIAWPGIAFDLAFLDIQMKNMNGIKLAEYIRKNDQNILLVFLTAFRQYVLKGYDVNALHYLIKPLSAARLLPVLDKAYFIWQSTQIGSLTVASESGLYKLPFHDIFYISMLAHNAEVYTAGAKYVIRKTAKELTELLPNNFLRCHRSYIVNPQVAGDAYPSCCHDSAAVFRRGLSRRNPFAPLPNHVHRLVRRYAAHILNHAGNRKRHHLRFACAYFRVCSGAACQCPDERQTAAQNAYYFQNIWLDRRFIRCVIIVDF